MSTLCSRSTSTKLGSFLKVQTDRLRDTGITGVSIVSAPCSSSTSIKLGSFLKVQTERLRNTGITGVSIVSAPCSSCTSIKLGSFLKVQTDRLRNTGITGVSCPPRAPVVPLSNWGPSWGQRQFKEYRYYRCVVSAPCSSSTSTKLGSLLKVQTDRLRNTGITGVSCPPRAPVVPLPNWGLC